MYMLPVRKLCSSGTFFALCLFMMGINLYLKNLKKSFSKIMLHVPEADKGVPYNHHLIKIASVKFLRITVEILYAWPVILKLIIKKLFTKQMLM